MIRIKMASRRERDDHMRRVALVMGLAERRRRRDGEAASARARAFRTLAEATTRATKRTARRERADIVLRRALAGATVRA